MVFLQCTQNRGVELLVNAQTIRWSPNALLFSLVWLQPALLQMYSLCPSRLVLLFSSDSAEAAVRPNVDSGCVTGGGPDVDGFSLSGTMRENVDSGLVTGGGPTGASWAFSTTAATGFGIGTVGAEEAAAIGAGAFSTCAIDFSTRENGEVEVDGVL